jgi:hypothetical protein
MPCSVRKEWSRCRELWGGYDDQMSISCVWGSADELCEKTYVEDGHCSGKLLTVPWSMAVKTIIVPYANEAIGGTLKDGSMVVKSP